MKTGELIEKGYVYTIFMDTENGGDYISYHYFDKDGNYTTKDLAHKIIARECNMNGDLLSETFMINQDNLKNK